MHKMSYTQQPQLTALARRALAVCPQGWCSWCLTLTEHELVAKGSATPSGSDQYRCMGCRSTTRKCANYCGGMAAGPTRELCAVCLVPGSKWESAHSVSDERNKLACTSPRTGRGEERRPVWQRDVSAIRCPQVRPLVAYEWRTRLDLTSGDAPNSDVLARHIVSARLWPIDAAAPLPRLRPRTVRQLHQRPAAHARAGLPCTRAAVPRLRDDQVRTQCAGRRHRLRLGVVAVQVRQRICERLKCRLTVCCTFLCERAFTSVSYNVLGDTKRGVGAAKAERVGKRHVHGPPHERRRDQVHLAALAHRHVRLLQIARARHRVLCNESVTKACATLSSVELLPKKNSRQASWNVRCAR